MIKRIRESTRQYVEAHQNNLPLNALGRVAIIGGFAGIIARAMENAPTQAGIKPAIVVAAGCVLEFATKPAEQ